MIETLLCNFTTLDNNNCKLLVKNCFLKSDAGVLKLSPGVIIEFLKVLVFKIFNIKNRST